MPADFQYSMPFPSRAKLVVGEEAYDGQFLAESIQAESKIRLITYAFIVVAKIILKAALRRVSRDQGRGSCRRSC